MSDRKREREREREHERETLERDAHMSALEDDLTAARRRVAELADDRDPPEPKLEKADISLIRAGHDGAVRAWLGAPVLLRLSRRFDGAFPPDRFEQVLERIRSVTQDPGVAQLMDKSFLWSSSADRQPIQPHLMVRLTITEAGPSKTPEPEHHANYTTLIVTDRLEALVGRLFGAFGSVLGAGGLAAPVAASIAFPILTPVFVLGWLGGVYGATRVLYRKTAGGRAQLMQRLFDTLVDEIMPHIG